MVNNKNFIDLHVHSNYSDGALSPAQLVQRAKKLGLSTIAIADHDSVAGVAEGKNAGMQNGIHVIPAVELSVQYKTLLDVHLLGFGIDYTDLVLVEKLNEFRERREHRNIEILDRVNEKLRGEEFEQVPLAEVLAHAREVIGRPHIARALLDRGYVKNMEDAFRRYLIPCNVPKFYWPVQDALSMINRLGGIAVLAHPTSISSDREELQVIITELASMGLNGLEVYNNMAQPDEMEFLRRLAGKLDLLITGGSDFHGMEEGIEMGKGRGGIRFTDTLLAPVLKRLHV
ncbi:MAG: phosphatase [Geobacteraceae bacterium GWC2_48_7]|nr:MAG: phosphatase [Geobacteraceae bacterium GWC2_48_7]